MGRPEKAFPADSPKVNSFLLDYFRGLEFNTTVGTLSHVFLAFPWAHVVQHTCNRQLFCLSTLG